MGRIFLKYFKKISILISIILISLILLTAVSATDEMVISDGTGNYHELEEISVDDITAFNDYNEGPTIDYIKPNGSSNIIGTEIESPDVESNKDYSNLEGKSLTGTDVEDNSIISSDFEAVSINQKSNSNLGAGSTKSFSALAQEIESSTGTLTLTDNYKYTSGDDQYKGGLIFNRDLTIIGPATIDGSGLARIFGVVGGHTLKLVNLNIINGFNDSYGAGLYTDGSNLIIDNCNFTGHTIRNVIDYFAWGSAIYAVDSNVSIDNSRFERNWFTGTNGTSTVCCYGTTLNISNCLFKDNRAINYTAGVFYYNTSKGKIVNSNFTQNVLTGDDLYQSGAVYWYGPNAYLENCTFTENKGKSGGAVVIFDKNGTINRCTFIGNTAYEGGAVAIFGTTTFCINGSYFKKNSAQFSGAVRTERSINVTNSIFDGNMATYGDSGAIGFNYDIMGNIRQRYYEYLVDGCLFINNYAGSTGNAIDISAGRGGVINNSIFINNTGYLNTTICIAEGVDFPTLGANWYGNTAENYNISLHPTNKDDYILKQWLFLNVTNETVNDVLTFSLNNLYDNETGQVSVDNDFHMLPINFTFETLGFVLPEVCEMNRSGIGTVQFIFDGTTEEITIKYITVRFTAEIERRPTGPYLRLNSSNIIYGNDAVVNVMLENVDSGTSGIAVLNFSGTLYNVQITNCRGSQRIKGLAVGDYNFSAVFESDAYGSLFNKNRLKVYPCEDMAINVTIDDIHYGQHLIIDARLNTSLNNSGSASVVAYDNRGRLAILLEDLEFVQSKLYVDYDSILSVGNYTATIRFKGNENITETSVVKQFNVLPATPSISVSIDNITYGSSALAKVNVTGVFGEGLNGTAYVNISGVNMGIFLRNGLGNATFSNLNVGTYTVKARYEARGNYSDANETTSLKVSPIDALLNITVKNINYGEDAVINISLINSLSKPLNGTVQVKINGTIYNVSVIDGVGIRNVPLLNIGTYKVNATYNESANYNPVSKNCTFKVSPIDPALRITVDSIDYGQDAIINIKLTGFNNVGLNGTVIVTLNGVNHTIAVSKGSGSKEVSGLDVGIYENVVAKVNASGNYNKANDTTLFAVRAISPGLRLSIDNIDYGEDAIAKVYLTGLNNAALNGSVLVNLKGVYYLVSVKNGVGSTNIPDLAAGTYNNVEARFLTSGNYKEFSNYTSFTVAKASPSLGLSIDNIVYGNNAIIKVNLTGINDIRLNGTVIITLDGANYSVKVSDGIGSKAVSGLNAKTYSNVIAKINASANYKNASATDSFVVSPAKANLTVSIADINYGNNAIAKVTFIGVNNEKLTANMNLTINGTKYPVSIVNGAGSTTISNLKVGHYDNVLAYVPAFGNYEAANATCSFAVKGALPNLTVSVNNITYGGKATVNIGYYGLNQEALDGTVNLTVDGKDYAVQVKSGKGNKTISSLAGGNYVAYAKVGANGQYDEANASASFKVNPRSDLKISVNVENITFGQRATINATLTGYNNEKINGTLYYRVLNKTALVYSGTLDVINGTASGRIGTLLDVANYTVNASFANSNYKNKSATDNFSVSKSGSGLSAYAEDIAYGNTAKVNVYLYDDVLPDVAYVDFYLNGQFYNQVAVNKGEGSISIPGLKVGNYSIFLYYEKEYGSLSHIDHFNVIKAQSSINVTGSKVEEGKDATLTVTVKNGTTPLDGTAIVTVNDIDYAVALGNNGIGTLTISGLESGEYPISARYLGNANYDSALYAGSAKITVESKPKVWVLASAKNYQFNQTGTLIINVTDSKGNKLSGNVTVLIDGNQYSRKNIANGHLEIQLSGLNSGLHAVEVSFSNDKYSHISNGTQFNVTKASPVITVTGDSIVLGKNATVNVTVKCGNSPVAGIAIVTVNGIDHAVTVGTNGKGTLTIPGLPFGQYNVAAKFLENDNYKAASFTGSAKIVVSSDLITFDLSLADNNTKIAVSNAKDAGGKAIDGQIKGEVFKNGAKVADLTKATLGGGSGTISIPSTLDVGDYTAQICVVALDGSTAYENISFTVNPQSGVKVNASAISYDFDETGTLVINVTDASGKKLSGNVTVMVDGNQYSKKNITNGYLEIPLTKLGIGIHAAEVIFTKPNYLNASAIAYFNVTKVTPVMAVTGSTVEYGKDSVLKINVTDQKGKPVNGTVIVTVNCTKDGLHDVLQVKNGVAQASFRLDSLGAGPGTYSVNVTYVENDKYNSVKKTDAKLIVTKSTDLAIDVAANEPDYGKDTVITVTAADGSGASVSISKANVTIDGQKSELDVSKGKINLGKLPAGEHAVVVSVNDGFHKIANASLTAKVNPISGVKVNISALSYPFDESGNLSINVSDSKGNGLSGNVNVLVDGSEYVQKAISNGHLEIPLSNLAVGEHAAEVIFTNPNYLDSSAIGYFNVTKVTPIMTVTGSTVRHGEISYVDIQVTDQNGKAINGTVIVSVDLPGEELYDVVELNKGIGQARFSLEYYVGEGVYVANVTYVENDKYVSQKSSAKLTVSRSTKLNLEVTDNSPSEGEDVILSVSATDGSGAAVTLRNVNVTVNGKSTQYPVKDGKVNIGQLPVGTTSIQVLVDDGFHDRTTVTKKVTVSEPEMTDTVLTVTTSNIKYGDKEVIRFALKDIKGNKLNGTLNVTIGNQLKTGNVSNGVGNITLSNLTAGNYPVVANFSGTNKYGASTGTGYFNVAKNATRIIFEDMNTTAVDPKNDGRTGEYFYFTLKDANGNVMPNTPMQIGFNGKVYTYEKDGVCTNEKGVARLQINLGYKGDYTFAVCFLGDDNHNASFVVAKIKVACQKPTLTVPNKYCKASDKVKTLTATFKNEHGNLIAGQSVKFTVGGKTYSAKTNDKGVATVNVSLNKKGTYEVVAQYGGSSTYAEVTKKATLIIA